MNYHPLPEGFREWAPVLSTFASRIIGKPVTVLFRPFTDVGGEAYLSENGYVVALSESMKIEHLEQSYFHELGHLANHDCYIVSEPAPCDTLHPVVQLEALIPEFPSAGDILAAVEAKEDKADAKGRELQMAFEADLGIPLIDLFI